LSEELSRNGLHRQVLCVGYGGGQIAAHYAGRADADFKISLEDTPLGTGGAVANAMPYVTSDPFVIVNGDSFCRVPYPDLLAMHAQTDALMTVVVAPATGRSDVALIRMDRAGRILKFTERSKQGGSGERFVNAGIYVVQREVLALAPSSPAYSLEYDLIPAIVKTGRCHGYPVSGPLIDIGTPERYLAAQGGLP